MMTPDTTVLTMSRVYNAPREKVFNAWADAELLRQWMGPRPVPLDACEMDFREGGQFRFGFFIRSENRWMYVGGVFETIRSPEKLVLTWTWDEGETSLVTVDFAAQGTGTLMTLTHERLEDAADVEGHRQGWEGSFNKIAALL